MLYHDLIMVQPKKYCKSIKIIISRVKKKTASNWHGNSSLRAVCHRRSCGSISFLTSHKAKSILHHYLWPILMMECIYLPQLFMPLVWTIKFHNILLFNNNIGTTIDKHNGHIHQQVEVHQEVCLEYIMSNCFF